MSPPLRLSADTLPSATSGRFFLLIATAFAGSAYIYGWLSGRTEAAGDFPAVCARMAQGAPADLVPDTLVRWYADCSRWASLMSGLLIVLMMGAFAAVTLAIYLAWPYLAQRGLSPVERVMGVDRHRTAFYDLVARHGGGRRIRLWVDTANLPNGSRAFGRIGAYHLSLRLDHLRGLADDAPSRGVVLHELAHIRSRDVDLTYLAVAVWWGYLAAVAVPFLAIAASVPALLLDYGWRAVLMLALLWMVRASVLRSREHYADATAASGHPDDEHAVAESLMRGKPPTGWRRLYSAVNHPSREDRVRALRDGHALFRLDTQVALATGLLVGLAYTPSYYLFSLLLPDRTYLRGWLCGLLFGILVAIVLGGSVWRATLWSLANGLPAQGGLLAVAGFTAGLLAGQLLTPPILTVGSWGAVLRAAPVFAVAPAILLFAGSFLCLLWTKLGARGWLSVTGSPRWAYRIGMVQAAAVFGVWLAAWFQLVELSSTGETWAVLGVFAVSVIVNPALITSLIWAFGYAASTWQTSRMARRRRAYAFWRSGARADLPGEPATGLGFVYIVTFGAVAAYSAIEPFYYGHLRLRMEAVDGAGAAGISDILIIAAILLAPAVFIATVAALVQGFAAGGRGRTGEAVTTAGIGLMLMAAVLFVTALFHLYWASALARDPLILLRALSGWGVLGPVPDDHPEPALGVMVSALYMAMLMLGLPAAAVGSWVRSWLTERRTVRPRPFWLTTIQAVPLLLLAIVLMGLTFAEWDVRTTLPLPDAVDQTEIDRIVGEARPDTLTREQTCGALLAEFADQRLAGTTAAGQLDTHLATAAKLTLSTQDPTLHSIGRSIGGAAELAEVQQAAQGIAVALQYCAAAGSLTVSGAG